jgi:hypothetical protein
MTVLVRWGDTALASREIAEGRQAVVGAAPASLLPIPCDMLGVPSVTVAARRGGLALALVPEGAVAFHERAGQIPCPVSGPVEIALAAGEKVSFAIGAFLISVAASPAVERWPVLGRARARAALASAAPIALAALAHGLVLGMSARSARAASVEETAPAAAEMSRYLAAADARAAAREQPEKGDLGPGGGKRVDVRDGNGKADGGARAEGAAGTMGSPSERAGAKGRYAVAGDDKPAATALSRAEAIADARSFGLAGVLAAEGSRAPVVSFGQVTASGQDTFSARGDMWGPSIAETFGAGGLGLSGTGEGGGGAYQGIGLGSLEIGHGLGHGIGTGGRGSFSLPEHRSWRSGPYGHICYPYGNCRPRGPFLVVHVGAPVVQVLGVERFPGQPESDVNAHRSSVAEVIQRVTLGARDALRRCHFTSGGDDFESRNVHTRFVVRANGQVASVTSAGTSMPAPSAACVTRVFQGLTFPPLPRGKPVGVISPVYFHIRNR